MTNIFPNIGAFLENMKLVTPIGESIQGGMVRVLEYDNMSSLTKDVMEEGDGAADSMRAGWNGMQPGRVLFTPEALSEKAHPGCANSRVKLHWIAEVEEVDESGLGGPDERKMMASGPENMPCGPQGLEEHEIGPAPQHNQRPPFAVGDYSFGSSWDPKGGYNGVLSSWQITPNTNNWRKAGLQALAPENPG